MAKEQEKTMEQRLEEALVLYEKTPYKPPSNWCWVVFKSLCHVMNGYAFKSSMYVEDGIRIIRITNVQDGYIEDDKPVYYSQNDIKGLEGFLLKENDILVSLTGNVGRVAIIQNDMLPAALNQRVACLRPEFLVNRQYVYYYLLSEEFRKNCFDSAKGVAQQNMSTATINEMAFPLAPLEEQKRIVDVIEKQFAKLDEARDLIQKSLDSFAERKSAVFHKAFTGELTKKWREVNNIIFEWEKRKLSDIGELVTGTTPDKKKSGYYKGNFPFVKPADLNQGRRIVGAEETLSEEGKKASRVIRAGSTCVCCIGATISKCGFLQVEATTNQQINSIMPFDFMDDLFVYYYCCTDDFKQRLIDKSSATTLPIINKRKMADLEIVVPSKPEQEEISRILDSVFEKEDKSKELIDMLGKIDEMKKSILARAFRGKLGTSNPTDESATDLLKRILEYQASIIDERKKYKRKTNKDFPFSRRLSRRQRKICDMLIQNDGLSIDKIAQGVGKDVRFLFADLRELTDKRMIKLVDDRYWINADNQIKNQ